MKKKDAVLREYFRSLPDEDLRYVIFRLAERKSGDLGEAVELIQTNSEMDRVFATARNADGLYDLIDEANEYALREQTDREREFQRRPRTVAL